MHRNYSEQVINNDFRTNQMINLDNLNEAEQFIMDGLDQDIVQQPKPQKKLEPERHIPQPKTQLANQSRQIDEEDDLYEAIVRSLATHQQHKPSSSIDLEEDRRLLKEVMQLSKLES